MDFMDMLNVFGLKLVKIRDFSIKSVAGRQSMKR